MSADADNLRAISEALRLHDRYCEAEVERILLNPFEHERLGWDYFPHAGSDIPVEPDRSVPTGRVRLECDEAPQEPESRLERRLMDLFERLDTWRDEEDRR